VFIPAALSLVPLGVLGLFPFVSAGVAVPRGVVFLAVVVVVVVVVVVAVAGLDLVDA
jgi:hypothetical protein